MAGSTYDFDFGTAGVAATAADHADWTQVDNTMTYRANGRISTNTLEYGANTYNSFNIAPSATGVLYIQLYFMHSTRVADRHWLCAVYGGASEVVAQLSIRYDAGNYIIRARDKEIAAGTGTTQLAEDTWYRIDWTLNRTAGTQTCTLHAGANLDSATPTETIVAGGAGTLNDSTATTMNEIRFGNHITETSGSLVEFDRVAWSDTAMPTPYNAATPVPGVAVYNLSTTYAQNQDDSGNATYEVDTTGSTGTTTLVQQSGTTAAPSESPTGVFTITDPGGTDTLTYLLTAAGADGGADDTETINISRGAGTVERPVVYTFQGGDYTSAANWT